MVAAGAGGGVGAGGGGAVFNEDRVPVSQDEESPKDGQWGWGTTMSTH